MVSTLQYRKEQEKVCFNSEFWQHDMRQMKYLEGYGKAFVVFREFNFYWGHSCYKRVTLMEL